MNQGNDDQEEEKREIMNNSLLNDNPGNPGDNNQNPNVQHSGDNNNNEPQIQQQIQPQNQQRINRNNIQEQQPQIQLQNQVQAQANMNTLQEQLQQLIQKVNAMDDKNKKLEEDNLKLKEDINKINDKKLMPGFTNTDDMELKQAEKSRLYERLDDNTNYTDPAIQRHTERQRRLTIMWKRSERMVDQQNMINLQNRQPLQEYQPRTIPPAMKKEELTILEKQQKLAKTYTETITTTTDLVNYFKRIEFFAHTNKLDHNTIYTEIVNRLLDDKTRAKFIEIQQPKGINTFEKLKRWLYLTYSGKKSITKAKNKIFNWKNTSNNLIEQFEEYLVLIYNFIDEIKMAEKYEDLDREDVDLPPEGRLFNNFIEKLDIKKQRTVYNAYQKLKPKRRIAVLRVLCK